ncbi:hypothetical protein ERW51_00555 [Aliivibrio finisterrensis]|uniref:hypothetical protein n=1 Tax=Aliivibrio finisterrensis TaxID=511998 RepID=UPI0010214042|nr:hypothetical protein [Aliivibrio finisterrensis]RYU71167.1 hypothetical protein ERW54_00555 [Aliivibrio finisterrensis]RYU74896.1 hypothetical protein ERW51_00555 [Aliivibrio finisterrensis]RYU77341.1 hypothetical protein ERW48_00565 [Aliivibrio finisterrensis]
MNNDILQCLNNLYALSNDNALVRGRYLVLRFDGSKNASVEELVIKLQELDRSRLSDVDIDRFSNNAISSISFIKSNLNVYKSFKELVNAYFPLASKGELTVQQHEQFFLFDKQYSEKPIFDCFKALQDWIIWLKKVTGNYYPKDNDTKIMFYLVETIEDDKKVKTHELSLECAKIMMHLFDIKEVPSELKFNGDENYAAEKNLIAKSALTKTLKSASFDFCLLSVISDSESLLHTFKHNYEFYIQKFSIDKFTREIESAKIEYFEKINSIIHDNQAKALSIPVVILGTSLLRSWNVMSAILIFTAMVLALYLVLLNLNHKTEAINDCIKSAKKALENIDETTSYQNSMSTSSGDVTNVFIQIKAKGEGAIKLLANIKLGIICAALVWLIYMVCFYLNSSGTCPLS